MIMNNEFKPVLIASIVGNIHLIAVFVMCTARQQGSLTIVIICSVAVEVALPLFCIYFQLLFIPHEAVSHELC